jgi:sterol desaturase/sphingolipid hydroxylase (fatty acid hydroxylase superfamily)
VEPRRTDALKASPPMFETRWLDKLTRVHPIIPVLVFVPAILILFALGQEGVAWPKATAMIAAGWLFWTLTEYWIHRVIFHFEPEEGFGARLHWMIHGVHHDHPNDPLRLVMPPSVSIPLASLFVVGFHAVMPSAEANLFAVGFLTGYVVYDELHYHLHHRMPTTRLGKLMRELHMRHHFQDDTTGFGISAPYWDVIFGTLSRRRAAADERSQG